MSFPLVSAGKEDKCKMTCTRRLAILFWVYVAQAFAGAALGFTMPFLHYFGFF